MHKVWTSPNFKKECLVAFDQKAGDNSQKQCSPAELKLRGEAAELVASQVKPVLVIRHSCSMQKQGN